MIPQDKLDTLDFVPTEAELEAVDRMATQITQDLSAKKKFEGRRNRSAWKRMNRPDRTEKIDRGGSWFDTLFARFGV